MNELSLLDSFFGNDGLFPAYNYRLTTTAPRVDVVQNGDSYEILMDLPGKTEKDVDITLKNDVLTISSAENKKEEKKADEKDYLIRERFTEHTSFRRSFTLPKDIDESKVSATFKSGILTIEIARKQDAAEKKISITAVE